MVIDPTLAVAFVSLIATCGGFMYTWFREGRTRRWQLDDAEKLATKLSADAKDLATKVNAEASALAAKAMADAAIMAAKVVDDAEKIAIKVHDSAEKLANKVAENTTVSTDAARGAKEAYTEANSINAKIADLNRQLLVMADHIRKDDDRLLASEQAATQEALFNKRVKQAIEEKLIEMNGHAPRALRGRAKAPR